MFHIRFIIALSVLVLILSGCSEDSDNPTNQSPESEIILFIGLNEQLADLVDFSSFDYEGTDVVQLGDLISENAVSPLFSSSNNDPRDNCVFRFYAVDGFTPIDRGRPDLDWTTFQQGVIAVESHNTYYPSELELPGAYNVVELESIHILPKLSLSTSDTIFWYDLADFDYEIIEELDVISLASLAPDSLITRLFSNWSAENHQRLFSYRFNALDGFSPFNVGREDLTWDIFQQGQLEIISRNTRFPEELGLPGSYNTSNLASVSIHRKLNVDSPSDSLFLRIDDLETETITTQNEENIAVSFADLVPEEYRNSSYLFSCYGVSTDISTTPEMEWEDFQNGYYLIEKDKTWFGGGQFADNDYRIRFVEGIRISQQ